MVFLHQNILISFEFCKTDYSKFEHCLFCKMHIYVYWERVELKTLYLDSLERTEFRLFWVFSWNAKFEFN